jgi:hypothetical protein
MFSTFGMSKARQEDLHRAAKQRVSRPRLGRFGKKIVRLVVNASDHLVERRLGSLDISESVVTR